MIYNVLSVGVDADGKFHVTYYGDVPEQGGLEFKKGQVGVGTPKDAGAFVSHILTKNLDTYLALIKKKEEKNK